MTKKENVRKISGVVASVFAHTGKISKEEAKEISGLDDTAFEEVFEKASRVADNLLEVEGKKLDKFCEHFGKEIEAYMKEVYGHLLD